MSCSIEHTYLEKVKAGRKERGTNLNEDNKKRLFADKHQHNVSDPNNWILSFTPNRNKHLVRPLFDSSYCTWIRNIFLSLLPSLLGNHTEEFSDIE